MDVTKTKRTKSKEGTTKRIRIPKEKKPLRSEMTTQSNDIMFAILDSNIAASGDTDAVLLDSSSYQGSPETLRADIETLTTGDATAQAPMKVTVAAVAAKIWKPEWDTRKHQAGLGGLKSLRTVDHSLVAKHLHKLGYYKTATEGALTRTFERKHAYNMDYPGEIKPLNRKLAFLRVIGRVNDEYSQHLAETILRYFLGLLKTRKAAVDALKTGEFVPKEAVSLKTVKDILTGVFDIGTGMSASPAIVFHALCIVVQPFLWDDATVSPLKHHTAADATSKAIGDVEAYKNEAPFMSAEIKHKLTIDESIVLTFSQKTANVPLRFILTTAKIAPKYTDDNILIGNVTDVVLQYLHTYIIRDAHIAKTFLTQLRTEIMGSNDIGADNKGKVDEIFRQFAV